MPIKDAEKRKEYQREYARRKYSNPEQKEKRKQRKKEWNETNREHTNAYQKERYHSEDVTLKRKESLKDRQEKINSIRQAKGCSICGENHIACLDFHHVNPSDKEGSISEMIYLGYAWDTILKEIEKCIVVCSNCHRKLHHEMNKENVR